MKIRTKFASFSAAIVLLDMLLLILTAGLLQNQNQLIEAQASTQSSLRLTAELRQSTEDLTRLARTYAITGDSHYESAYRQALAIRNGKEPRADGQQISLRELMRRMSFTAAEIAKLKEVEDKANRLVATETAAFQALEGHFTEVPGGTSLKPSDYTRVAAPDRDFAIRIMHDSGYHADHARIMTPINEVNAMVETRTSAELGAFAEQGRLLINATVLVGLLLAGLIIASHILAQRPVLTATQQVQAALENLCAEESGLTAAPLLVTSNDEIGGIAAALNKLIDKLYSSVARIHESGKELSAFSTGLSVSTDQIETTLNGQLRATDDVVASAKRISETAEVLVRTMADVVRSSDEAAESAGQGQSGLARMRTTMEKMETSSSAIAHKLGMITEKVTNITGMVTTINKVADQTNLLSLNAAIEAEKAGEYGSGFSIIAREVRRLADQTAVATLDIEMMAEEMQAAVSAGVTGMEKFVLDVQSAVQEVHDISSQIGRIIAQVQGLGPQFQAVNEGMESQSVGAHQISTAMIHLSNDARAAAESQMERRSVALATVGRVAHALLLEVDLFRAATPEISALSSAEHTATVGEKDKSILTMA